MKKTNFKCMYLIDDMLYKKSVISNTTSKSDISNINHQIYHSPSSDLKAVEHHQLPELKTNDEYSYPDRRDSSIIEKDFIKPNMERNHTEKCVCMSGDSSLPRDKGYHPSDNNTVTDSSSNHTNSKSNVEAESEDMDINISPDESDNPSKKIRVQENKILNKSQNQDDNIILPNNSNNLVKSIVSKNNQHIEKIKNKHKNKNKNKNNLIKSIVSKNNQHIKKIKNKNKKIEEDEWRELREKMIRVREDIEWPPRSEGEKNTTPAQKKTLVNSELGNKTSLKTSHNHTPSIIQEGNENINKLIEKFTHIENKNDKVIYICTICGSNFNSRKALVRHLKHIHDDFFPDEKRKKRKHNDEDLESHKKIKPDTRGVKREGGSITNPKKKKKRGEILCVFCGLYFKNEMSLNRHEKNIHDSLNKNQKGLKRKNYVIDSTDRRYNKRHKNEKKIPVTYENYF